MICYFHILLLFDDDMLFLIPNRFGQGYTVTIRVGGDNVDIQPVISFIEQAFPGAMQQELHHNMVQYQLVNTLPVAQIFQTIKNVKEKLDIEDYSVCQTTLDQVHINFILFLFYCIFIKFNLNY